MLSTARDIIFLWVARMIMFGIELTGRVPYTDVNIHSVIQAPDGRRMSKSLGTGIDPSDLIDGGPRPPVYEEGGEFPAYGADALRFGLLAMSSSQDVRFNEERVKQGRDLANKLWNASRLILLRVSEVEPDPRAADAVEDRWIVSRLERHTQRATEQLDGFRFSHAALELYEAFWSELCDWYLELAKPRLYEEDNAAVSGVLLHALDRTLRLLHPAMPFVTEEIWSLMPSPGGERGLLAVAEWPLADPSRIDEAAEAEVGRLIEAVTALRRYRDEVNAKAGSPVRARLAAEGYDSVRDQLARLARFELVPDDASDGDVLATLPIPGGAVLVLPSEAFDAGEASRRIEAKRERLRTEIERAERKLANEGFVAKAPPEVVEGERRKLAEYREALEALGERVNLPTAEEYLLGLELFGMRFGLDRMHRLMTVLGLPQRRFASIHVVGSNGKSSTVRFAAAILARHGLRTGSYTSPHLGSFRERVEVGEEPVPEGDFAAAVARAAQAAELVNRTRDPDDGVTQFEALTAAAYHELARRGVEVAVIEAGLGGRYDATNVIPSKVVALTSVGLEHTRWLGPTIEDIAG